MAYVIRVASGEATAADLAVVDTNVDAILEDTGTTLPATLASILEDTGTTLDTIVDDILTDTGTTVPAQITALPQEASYANSRHIAVTANMAVEAWNTVATHEVLTVTGLVRVRMWIECTDNLASAGDGATIQFGVEGVTNAFIAATAEDALDAGDLWYDASPTVVYDTAANVIMDYVVNGLDIGYEILVEALTAGMLVFHCVWEPLNATGAVVIGAGGAL